MTTDGPCPADPMCNVETHGPGFVKSGELRKYQRIAWGLADRFAGVAVLGVDVDTAILVSYLLSKGLYWTFSSSQDGKFCAVAQKVVNVTTINSWQIHTGNLLPASKV
jgi:hypothetical protein